MPKLRWDQPGEHRYETGIDRGVLYLSDGSGVPWNGLVSVQVNAGAEVTPLYFDGIKYLETRSGDEFGATLTAMTYPDEFLEYDGYQEVRDGVLMADQPVVETFGLSYRTLVGNDTEGQEHGYKIHILYDLTAVPSDVTFNTLSSSVDNSDFAWKLTGVPQVVPGFKPAVHLVIDSRTINEYLLRDLESLLYGEDASDIPVDDPDDFVDGGATPSTTSDDTLDGGTYSSTTTDVLDGGTPSNSHLGGGSTVTPGVSPSAKLVPMATLVQVIKDWVLMDVVDHGDGTWSLTAPDEFITMLDDHTFMVSGVNATYLDADTYEVTTTHGI